MKPLNYLRHATEELRGEWIPSIEPSAPETAKICRDVLEQCAGAVKFLLPEGGRILKDGLKGLRGLDEIHLPFREIVIEYASISGQLGLVERLIGEDNSVVSPKRIIYAWELDGKIHIHSIVQLVTKNGDRVWVMQPVICVVWAEYSPICFALDCETYPEEDIDFITASILPAGELYDVAYGEKGKFGLQCAYVDMTDEYNAVLELIEALSCSNVSHEALPIQKQNKSSVKRGCLPFDEYRILVVNKSANNVYSSHDGTHRSPREHLRRGHIRIIASGKRIWINSCIVNAGTGGRIDKSYDMKNSHTPPTMNKPVEQLRAA